MKTLILSATAAGMLAVSAMGDTWPAGSCVVSGTTNRTCAAVATQSLSSSLDSYWLGVGSGTLAARFYTKKPTGAIIVFR